MPYIGQSLTEGTRREYTYVATASQTTFNAIYTVGAVDVYQNGVLLAPSDYTATTGTTVVFNTGAALNDEITIHCHNTFSVADTVSASQGGTFNNNIDVTGTVTADGLTVNSGTTSTSVRIGNSGTPYAVLYNDTNGVAILGADDGNTGSSSNLRFHVSGTECMRIDASGRVTMPYQPSFAGTFVGTMNGTTIVFNNVGHNDGGMYNTSIGRFTAPVAGKYLYQAILLKTENVTTRVDVILNGTVNHNLGQEMSYSSTSGYDHLVINSIYKMSAGDWIDLNIGTGSLNYNSAPSSQFNCLSITLLG